MFDTIVEIVQEFLEGTTENMACIEDLCDALLDVLTEAGIDVSQLSSEDLQQLITEVFNEQNNHIAATSSSISFTGLGSAARLADLQCGPTCGFEAIENFIQLNDLGYTNTLSDYLQRKEIFDGGSRLVDGGFSLDTQHYQHILSDFGIHADWQTFSHETLAEFLSKNRGILAVGDAHYLNSSSYPQMNSYHAFMITDVVHDQFGNTVGYKGLDSNFSNQEVEWSLLEVENALQHSYLEKSLLVSNKEMNWPYKTA